MTLEDLINEALKGKTKALDKLLENISPTLYAIAKLRLKSEEDANDAVQETLIKVYKNLHKIEHKEYFKTWVIEILKNECNKIYTRKKKNINIFEREVILTKDDMLENPMDDANGELDFNIMIEDLNEEEKLLLKLYYSDGYETREIANILDQNVNTTRSKILRAKIKLKNKMKGGNQNG